jgi:CBS domain-containing protein
MPPVSSHMSRDLLTVSPGVPLTEVAKRMTSRDVGAVMVVEDERLVGILTERDVLRAVATGEVEGTKVGAWMTHDPDTVGPDERPGHAAAIMIHGGYRHLPVLDGDTPVGIISIRDLMRLVIDDEAPKGG